MNGLSHGIPPEDGQSDRGFGPPRNHAMKTIIALLFSVAIRALAAEPSDVITVTLQNDAGFTASRIQVRAEAFHFDVPTLAPGASITRTVSRTGGNCGVTARFASGGAEHLAAAVLLFRTNRLLCRRRFVFASPVSKPCKLHRLSYQRRGDKIQQFNPEKLTK